MVKHCCMMWRPVLLQNCATGWRGWLGWPGYPQGIKINRTCSGLEGARRTLKVWLFSVFLSSADKQSLKQINSGLFLQEAFQESNTALSSKLWWLKVTLVHDNIRIDMYQWKTLKKVHLLVAWQAFQLHHLGWILLSPIWAYFTVILSRSGQNRSFFRNNQWQTRC